LQGIRSLDIDEAPPEEILQATVAAAIDSRYRYLGEPPEEVDQAASLLPRELQNVLYLPRRLRHCFVLRLLMAMSRECCARLLGLDVNEVDRNVSLAAEELALTTMY
jgi:DNA-directed RNA polymerase specialized sigma24 family protein